jgi:hypothetical protein
MKYIWRGEGGDITLFRRFCVGERGVYHATQQVQTCLRDPKTCCYGKVANLPSSRMITPDSVCITLLPYVSFQIYGLQDLCIPLCVQGAGIAQSV